MAQARRARAKVLCNGRDISNHIRNMSYTDGYDRTDDVSITLSDREGRWTGDRFPETGDTLSVAIELFDWNGRGDDRSLNLGAFEVDNVRHSEVVEINAVAVPISSSARSEKKDRAWVAVSLSGIAVDISGNAGLPLVYDTDIDPFYDNADQNHKSDLEFLQELCKSDGLCMKVTKGRLIVFEECKYESLPAIATIRKGGTDIIGFPTFHRNAKDVYKACEISHFDPKTDEVYTGYFEVPGAPDVGHTLRLREQYNSESDDMHLDRKARARCREKNKNEWQCDMQLKGDIIYFSGTNLEYEGWHRFDGKYHIATATHDIGSGGYTVTLETRRCLDY